MQSSKYLFTLASRMAQRNTLRTFNTVSIKRDSKGSAVKSVAESSPDVNQSSSSNMKDHNIGVRMVRPTDGDIKLLVWVKRYPSKDKVPEMISAETLSQAQSKARIKVCNYMIVITVIGCLTAVFLGKRQAEEGYDMQDVMLRKNVPK